MKYLVQFVGKKIRATEIGDATDVVHQLTTDKENYRQCQPITNGSDESQNHQHHIYAVGMSEDGQHWPTCSSYLLLLLPRLAPGFLHSNTKKQGMDYLIINGWETKKNEIHQISKSPIKTNDYPEISSPISCSWTLWEAWGRERDAEELSTWVGVGGICTWEIESFVLCIERRGEGEFWEIKIIESWQLSLLVY